VERARPATGNGRSAARNRMLARLPKWAHGCFLADHVCTPANGDIRTLAFQPAIEEPSNIWAFREGLLLDHPDIEGHVLPLAARIGVNRKSAHFTSLSLIIFRTFLAVVM
jgi:hypothetical protein